MPYMVDVSQIYNLLAFLANEGLATDGEQHNLLTNPSYLGTLSANAELYLASSLTAGSFADSNVLSVNNIYSANDIWLAGALIFNPATSKYAYEVWVNNYTLGILCDDETGNWGTYTYKSHTYQLGALDCGAVYTNILQTLNAGNQLYLGANLTLGNPFSGSFVGLQLYDATDSAGSANQVLTINSSGLPQWMATQGGSGSGISSITVAGTQLTGAIVLSAGPNISLGASATNNTITITDTLSLSGYATQAWVEDQGYITSLAGYATQSWIEGQNYATEAWVEAQGYSTGGSSGVTSINTFTGAISLSTGNGLTYTNGSGAITFSAVIGSGLSFSSGAIVNSGVTSLYGLTGAVGFTAGAAFNVSTSGNSVYLSLNNSASPTFGGLTLNGNLIMTSYAIDCAGITDSGGLQCGGLLCTGTAVFDSVSSTSPVYGPLYLNGSQELCYTSSSLRFKENVENLTDCSWLYKLRPVSFDWKDTQAKKQGRQIGLIAEQVAEINGNFVYPDKQGNPLGVHYEWLTVPLIVELQKLRREIDVLKAKLAI